MTPTQATSWADRLRRLSLACAVLAALTALTALLGWLTGLDILKRFVPGMVTMKINTITAVLSGCLAYVCQARGRGGLARLFAGGMLAIGLITLGEYAFGIQPGIDQLLIPEAPGDVGTGFPGRMSPITAFTFSLLGIALLMGSSRVGVAIAQIVAAVAGGVVFTSLVGYLYETNILLWISSALTDISIPAILALLALAAAVTLRHTETGPAQPLSSTGPGGTLMRSLIVPIWLLPVGIGALFLWGADRYYDYAIGMAFAMLVSAVLLLGLLWQTAIQIDQLDVDRLAALRRSLEQRRLQSILNAIPSGVLFVDAESRRLTANPFAVELLGVPPEGPFETVRGLEHICRPDGSPLPISEYPSSLALCGQTVVGRELLVCRDGVQVPVLANAAPVRDDQGGQLGAVVNYQDIRERRELDRYREEYVSLISHDLRTPLSVILGQADLLRALLEEHVTPDVERGLASINANCRRMNDMIEDLVETTRLESRRLALQREPIDLMELVTRLVDQVVPQDQRARVRVLPAPPLQQVSVDRRRVERLLTNLLSNALKYSQGTVTLQLAREPKGVLVSVSDEGPGIPAEELPHVFSKYTRGRGRERSSGLGLGLYISRLIVEAHGGTIWADSLPGRGSVFAFSLPIAPDNG